MIKSWIDHPQIIQYAIGLLYFSAVMAIAALAMNRAVKEQKIRQDRWLEGAKGNWE